MEYKGQSALEYLMTYGWALVVIVIVVAALFAMGILNPASYQSDNCRGFGKVAYEDHAISDTTGDFQISLGNGTGKTIATYDYNAQLDCDGDGAFDVDFNSTTAWKASRSTTMTFATDGVSACDTVYASGATYQSNMTIYYKSRKGFSKIETAVCAGTVGP